MRDCWAYPLRRLRTFPQWKEKERGGRNDLTDDSVVYILDNFTVVKDIFEEDDVVFDQVSEDWLHFCRDELALKTPTAEVPAAAP